MNDSLVVRMQFHGNDLECQMCIGLVIKQLIWFEKIFSVRQF